MENETKPETKPPEIVHKKPPEIPEGEPTQEHLFFNVMPKVKNSAMTEPTLKVQPMNSSAGFLGTPGPSLFSRYKLYFLLGGAAIVLVPLIYFGMNFLGSVGTETEDLLVQPKVKPSTSTEKTPSEEQPLFTTSQEWRDQYFSSCTDESLCGDSADPEHDGLTNSEEFKLNTDPNNPDSDQDGLADGDEVNVFLSNPLSQHSSGDPGYNDGEYFLGAYDLGTGKKMTSSQILVLSAKMKNLGLHQPTVKTLSSVLTSIYNFTTDAEQNTESSPPSPAILPEGFDSSLEAKQDRDTTRSNTIKNIEIALVNYYKDNSLYPNTQDFLTMFAEIKAYLKVATNPNDPVNKEPFVYLYASEFAGKDFTLSFYSEVAGQVIKKRAADAVKDSNSEQAGIYDDRRKNDLESMRTALLLYSQNNIDGNQEYVFPTTDKYKSVIVPEYITQIPKDPKTLADYEYQVSDTFDTFTLKAILDNPDPGTSGYLCNQEECRNY